MKRRLRKKLFLDEFAVMGFEFSASLSEFSFEQVDAFFDALLEFVTARNLEVGCGGTKDAFSGHIASIERYGSATEEDRAALEEWLKQQSGISDIVIEQLSDLYYGY